MWNRRVVWACGVLVLVIGVVPGQFGHLAPPLPGDGWPVPTPCPPGSVVLSVARPEPAAESAPVFARVRPDPSVAVGPVPPLPAGARPITVVVPFASADTVARTVVSWGYKDAGGKAGSGRQVFGPAGGVAVGEIAAEAAPASVEVKAVVDYVNPDVPDLEYRLTAAVDSAGAQAVVPTTANVLKQHLILKSRVSPDARDLLVVEFEHTPLDPARNPRRGHFVLTYPHLLRAEQTFLDRLLELPVKPDDGGGVTWRLTGTLAGRPVAATVKGAADQSAVTLVADADGRLAPTPRTP